MMNYSSYRDENELVNIIIGLTLPRSNFPYPLYELGYKVMAIEQSFINNAGKTVKPDIILANEDKSILILIEAKSGKNAEMDQLKNYNYITNDDLISNAGFNSKLLETGFEKLIGSETKKSIKNKVLSAMRDIRNEKPDYFSWDGSSKYWEIDENLKDPNYNQLIALKNIISNGEDIDGQMNIFEI